MGSASTRVAHLSAARSERAAQTRPQLDLQ